jgi:hypothetical protein
MERRQSHGCRLVDKELDDQLRKPKAEFSRQARQHLEECPRCRELYHWISIRPATIDLSPDLHNRIRGALGESLIAVKPIPSTRESILRFLVVFAALLIAVMALMGVDGLERMTRPQLVGITAILATGVFLLSASLAWQIAPGRRHRIPAKLLIAGFAMTFFTGAALLFPWRSPEAFIVQGWHCSLAGVLIAVPTAAVFWLLVRRGVPLAIGTFGGTLGAIAGVLAITMLQFKCTYQEALHLLVWHGGVLVASTAAGMLIARVVVR